MKRKLIIALILVVNFLTPPPASATSGCGAGEVAVPVYTYHRIAWIGPTVRTLHHWTCVPRWWAW